MSALAEPKQRASEPPEAAALIERAEVDRSCRHVVLFFLSSAILWLVAGSFLGFLGSWKLHNSSFLADYAWLTWGRVRTAHLNAVIYGWASQAGIGVAIWLMARLCRTKLRNGPLAMIAGLFYNIGVTVGIVGVLAGDSQSVEWLEFPAYATPLIFIAYALVAVWAIDMFAHRRPGHVYVSQWYLFAGLFWFPWLYGTANVIMQAVPLHGVTFGAVNWWFAHNVLGLWFTPIGLAAVYYMIPKVIGRPVHSYYLSALGFWSLALFYSWNGMHHLIGGPFPIWLVTASVVASMMMIIPVVTVAINHHMTMRGHFSMLGKSPALRFCVFGAMMYTLASLQGITMAIPELNRLTHFTHYTIGHAHLGMYSFFTMVMFGSIYYIVPRLLQTEWRSPLLIKWHFWLTALGSLLMFGTLSVGGIVQGLALVDPKINFVQTSILTLPYLFVRSLSGMAMLTGHLIFAAHFFLVVIGAALGATIGAKAEAKEALAEV